MRSFAGTFWARLIGMLLVALIVAPAVRLRADSPTLSVKTVDAGSLQGLCSNANNVGFAFDARYSVVAPFEASQDGNQDPFQGDNHFLYIADPSDPGKLWPYDLTIAGTSPTTFYYPTHLIVRPDYTSSSTDYAFVRATAWNPSLPDGNKGWEAIAYLRIDAGSRKGNPTFDSTFVGVGYFPIYPVSDSADPSAVPTCFGLSAKGNLLVATNGAQFFSIDVASGNKYTVQLIATEDYIPLPDPTVKGAATEDYNTITDLQVDSNNIVTVLVNSRKNGKDSSQLFFYDLLEGTGKSDGTFTSLAFVTSDRLGGAQIAPGSNAVTSLDGKLGYFATTDGSLWSVKLNGSATLGLTLMGVYPSLGAGPSPGEAEPRNIQIDSSGKMLSIFKQGAVLNIRRPAYGRHGGGIRRPAYAKYSEAPAVVVLHLDGKGVVADAEEAATPPGTAAISNGAFTSDGGLYFATSAGSLLHLDKTGLINEVGAAVPNISQIVSADASTLIGIQDFDVNVGARHPGIVSPGSLVFMSLGSAAVVTSSSRASIRRPCNANH